jgi:hypothetical protein
MKPVLILELFNIYTPSIHFLRLSFLLSVSLSLRLSNFESTHKPSAPPHNVKAGITTANATPFMWSCSFNVLYFCLNSAAWRSFTFLRFRFCSCWRSIKCMTPRKYSTAFWPSSWSIRNLMTLMKSSNVKACPVFAEIILSHS